MQYGAAQALKIAASVVGPDPDHAFAPEASRVSIVLIILSVTNQKPVCTLNATPPPLSPPRAINTWKSELLTDNRVNNI